MDDLKKLLQASSSEGSRRPYSVYTSVSDQRILNIPIMKPLLVCVLSGTKELGTSEQLVRSGGFVFFSNTPKIDMRNIVEDKEYFAIVIEFEYQDFSDLPSNPIRTNKYFTGQVTEEISASLIQFVQWADFAPQHMWPLRRKELLHLMYHKGFREVCSIAQPPSLTHQIEQILSADIQSDLGMEKLTKILAMSESTLRRKLSLEKTNFQAIKSRVKLSHGLHLLQSSSSPIGQIAEQCGYQSQSRFTARFKSLFGLTPTDLRRTRMGESGE